VPGEVNGCTSYALYVIQPHIHVDRALLVMVFGERHMLRRGQVPDAVSRPRTCVLERLEDLMVPPHPRGRGRTTTYSVVVFLFRTSGGW
jgi:hypothetical protein